MLMSLQSELSIVSNTAKVAERLIAHARLCRQIAKQSWSEDAALKLEKLADECLSAAAEIGPPQPTKIARWPN